MRIYVHEEQQQWPEGTRVAEVAAGFPGATLFVVNGVSVTVDHILRPGDECWCLTPGKAPSRQEMDKLLARRHTPEIQALLQAATVGIMGLGGLGSQVAAALARMGVGRLRLADFDLVVPSNLNRQFYFYDQIGQPKTSALADNLHRINPHVEVELVPCRLDEEAIKARFDRVDVLVECFDDPAMKALAFRLALTDLAPIRYVGASGVAGYGPNNTIRTTCPYEGVYLVGDGEADAGQGMGLMAARVGIAAHQQANQVLRLLLAGAKAGQGK